MLIVLLTLIRIPIILNKLINQPDRRVLIDTRNKNATDNSPAKELLITNQNDTRISYFKSIRINRDKGSAPLAVLARSWDTGGSHLDCVHSSQQ